MKPSKKIIILTAVVAAIVLFWLVPGINKANYTRYTRVYEDTDRKPEKVSIADTFTLYLPAKAAPPKVYKKESIEPEASLKDIEPEMFSRATHFHEDIILAEEEIVEYDSVQVVTLDLNDSVQYAVLDTVSVH